MKKMIFGRNGRQLGFARILEFFMKNKSNVFFELQHDVVGVATFYDEEMAELDEVKLDATIAEENITGNVFIAVKTLTDYLIGEADDDGLYSWYRFSEAPVVPAEYTEVDKETAIKIMLSRLPRNKEYAKGTWGLKNYESFTADERASVNVKLDEFLTGKTQRWDLEEDACIDVDSLRSYNGGLLVLRNGEDEELLCNVDSLVWFKGKMVAVDFKRGCYFLGVYRQ